MPKIRVKNLQTAQGIVEFALVLPVLLIVIFGVIGFGHLFFSYTSVVAASREAARWGSAVGVTDTLRPRYRDCHAIRATAVRLGSFAGVSAANSPDEATPGIAISFDHGPNDPDPDYDDCSDDLGPMDVAYGDRINVRVTVNYRPLVPLVNIPAFPLHATTSRTIIRGLPVGDRPTAQPACPTTTIIVEMLHSNMPVVLPAWPQVNEPVDVFVRVISSDGTSPTGIVDIMDRDPLHPDVIHTCRVTASSTGVSCGQMVLGVPADEWPSPPLVPEGYPDIGTKYISAYYDPRGACFQPSEVIEQPFDIIKADTIVKIISDEPDPSWPNVGDDPVNWVYPVKVDFEVLPSFPAGALPNGGLVTVSDQIGRSCSAFAVDGKGSCTLYPFETAYLMARYDGDSNFNPGATKPEDEELHTIQGAATLTPTPTATSLVTLTPFPSKTPTPVTCPYLNSAVDFSVQNAAQFEISNFNGVDTTVESVEITWPDEDPVVKLREVRFGTLANLGACTTGAGRTEENCLWQAPNPLNGLTPPQQTLSSKTRTWLQKAAEMWGGGSKYMYFLFNAAPPSGSYFFTIRFANNCVLEIPADY